MIRNVKKLLKTVIVSLCIFLFTSDVTKTHAAPSFWSFCVDSLLSSYAGMPAEQRSQLLNARWLRYKNKRYSDPVVVKLGDLLESEALYPESWPGTRTLYEQAVLELRRGDTVVYDRKRFKLGKFLGAGNATHIFELQDQEGAIRIPFLVSHLHALYPKLTRIQRILKFSKMVMEELPTKAGAVQILQADDPKGRYMVVERVTGTLKGYDLLNQVVIERRRLELIETIFYPSSLLKEMDDMTAEERKQFVELIELMKKNGKAEALSGNAMAIHVATSRQYLWGVTRKNDKPQWYLLESG